MIFIGEHLARGIASTMAEHDFIRVVGDGFRGGLSIVTPETTTREDPIYGSVRSYETVRDIAYGVPRPELDDFADLIRSYHEQRRA